MSSNKQAQASRHRAIQILLALFSAIFVAVVAYGYYHLLTEFGWFIALVGGGIIAAFAWFLARVSGTGEGGLKSNWILVVPLFIISAAGVYNTMMVYLEGGQVLSDAAASSQQQFARIEGAASTQLEANGVTTRINRINSLRDSLFSEIANPLNCGQGPEAQRLIAELRRELPDFTPLSNPANDCGQNQKIIEDYTSRIAALIKRSSWNDAELNAIVQESQAARKTLGDLQREISRSYSAGEIHQITSILESSQTTYQDLLFRLSRKTKTADFPQNLDIVGAQSLGNVYKLPALFFSRINEASSYVYLLVALGFDLLLVYLFQMATQNRVRKHSIDSSIAGAW